MKHFKLVLLFFLFFNTHEVFSQNEKFKALFMYNFTKNIEWPASTKQGNFIIGVLGGSPIVKELETIAAKMKVDNLAIVIKTFSSVEEISNCNILFLPSSKSSNLASAITKTSGKHVLIIADKAGLAAQGAGISYFMDGDKIKYEINPKNIEKNGLKVSGSLINLGLLVSK
jgi:hypothetical protein